MEYLGTRYATVEAAYQALSVSPDYPEIIALIKDSRSPYEAKIIAHKHLYARRRDWDERKLNVMRELLWKKTTQHEYVKKKLLQTGSNLIVEDSPDDYYWGCGLDRTGLNMLGRLWMDIRQSVSVN